jgi:hypothetical protein
MTNSSRYEGDFTNGERHGIGKQTSQNGSYYGEFDQGNFNGIGTFTWEDGKYYKGQFLKNKRHGFGEH